MTATYGPFAQQIWRDALLLPDFDDLLQCFAFEIGSYLGTSPSEAQKLMESAWSERSEAMQRAMPSSKDPEELANYYARQSTGVLVSAYWHSLVPDRYALHSVSGLAALQHFCTGPRVFEFGHGIGSTAILLTRNDFHVVAGDVSNRYREVAAQRVARRGLDVSFCDLNVTEPDDGAFDAVVSFDVLEHVPDPVRHIERMHRWLTDDGLLVLNIAFGRDPNNPEHIQPYRRGVLDRIRSLGFERIAWPTLLVFAKRGMGPVRRVTYRAQDFVGATTDDFAARFPRLGRLLRATSLPPLA